MLVESIDDGNDGKGVGEQATNSNAMEVEKVELLVLQADRQKLNW